MAAQPKTIGGGSAKPLANDWLNFLRTGLNSGSFGGGAINSTTGIAGVLNDLLAGGAGEVGGALGAQISRQRMNDVNSLRARFGTGGGVGFGTPAAYAEGTYLAQSAEQLPTALAGLQLQALGQLFPMFGQAVGLGTPQAQTVMQQSDLGAILQGATNLAGAATPFLRRSPFQSSAPAAGTPTVGVPDRGTNTGTMNASAGIDYESLRAAGLV